MVLGYEHAQLRPGRRGRAPDHGDEYHETARPRALSKVFGTRGASMASARARFASLVTYIL